LCSREFVGWLVRSFVMRVSVPKVTVNFWQVKVNVQGHLFHARTNRHSDDKTKTLARNHSDIGSK